MSTPSALRREERAGRVLVVDDDSRVRRTLRRLLEVPGHDVREAADGEGALAVVREWAPDVVLLDVVMPGPDGFEVCRRLKSDTVTASTHIILVTGLAERSDRLKGIDAGADDFLTKPPDPQEVVLRVRNAIYAKDLFDRVQRSYVELQELERLRDHLVRLIVHDMRAPLSGVLACLQLLDSEASERLTEEERGDLAESSALLKQLLEMVRSLLDISRLEQGELPLSLAEHCICGIARDSTDSLRVLARQIGVELHVECGDPVVLCDGQLIRRVFDNLVSNAIRFAPAGSSIRIACERVGGVVRVSVSDRGPGIPPEFHLRVFEKFGQVDSREEGDMYSTGLGLTFCKEAIAAHGGKIWVESSVGEGSTFYFTLPVSDGGVPPALPSPERRDLSPVGG